MDRYPRHIADYLTANSIPASDYSLRDDGEGPWIEEWRAAGKPPTPEDVAGWSPPTPDPDKSPAPSLEIRDYKTLDAALEAASTVAQVKAVFRQYLRRRAGL